MGLQRFRKIRLKLIVVFVTAMIGVFSLIFILNLRQDKFISENSSLAYIINISGRQRMLSQNISKTALLIVTDFNRNRRAEILDSLSILFESSHELLLAKNELLTNHAKTHQTLDSLFEELQPFLVGLLSYSSQIIEGQEDSLQRYLIGELLIQEAHFLPLMDRITKEYEGLGDQVLIEIKTNTLLVNSVISMAIFATVVGLFFFTIKILRHYSLNLETTKQELIKSVKEATFRIEKLEFLTGAIKVGIWEKSMAEQSEFWSDELYNILGYDVGEFLGTSENFVNRVHREDLQKLHDASEVSIRTGLSSTVEVRVQTKEGEYKWVEATGNVKRNAEGRVVLMVGGVIDINDRKKLETQLKVFIENAPAPIAMFNKDMEYIAVSQRWLEQYQITERVIIGVSHYDVFPDLSEEWRGIFNQSLETGHVAQRDQDVFYTADGAFQWLKWEVRPWYQNTGEIGGLLMFTEDITLERERNEELRVAKEAAEQASKAKEQFLATMSHEIRTPLNAINSLTQILLSESPRKDQLPHLNLLRFSGDNLLTLVNDILDISKIEAGKLTLEKTNFDLYYVIDSIRRSLNYRAQENLVQLETIYDQQLPRHFVGDVTRITQIIYNLAGNAIKFTKEGKVTIEVKLCSQEAKECTFTISVRDTGIGVSPEHKSKIFESFEQADSGTTRQYGGTGLGLYITKTLLEMMESKIELKSTLGEGSDFYFDITLEIGTKRHEDTGKSISEDLDFSKRNIYVLVAEDSPANQYIMRKFLSKVGVKYDIVEDGEKAVEQVNLGIYDMILMDLQMPVMDGYTATIKIRANKSEYFQQLPIIALTADAFIDIKKKTLAIGMSDYLSKPFKPVDLYAMIDQYAGNVKKRTKPQSKLEEIVRKYGEGDSTFISEFVSECIAEYESYMRHLKVFEANHDLAELEGKSHVFQTMNLLLNQQGMMQEVDILFHPVGENGKTGMQVDRILKKCLRIISDLSAVKVN